MEASNISSIVYSSTAAVITATTSVAAIPAATDAHQIQRSTAELVEILVYTLCLCVGGPLNLLSFHRLISQLRRPGSSSRQFGAQLILLKLHLNIADLITMFVYTLSQIIWMLTYQWHAGDLLCRLIKFFHTFSFYLNSFIVACFAIDRFLGTRNLNNPSASSVARTRAKRMLAFAWAWATLLSVPQCFIFRVFEPSELSNFKQCTPIWTIIGYELDLKMGALNETDMVGRRQFVEQFEQVVVVERVYNMAHLLFLFWIPSLLIAASYAAILITLNSLSVVPEGIKRTAAGATSLRLRRPQLNSGNVPHPPLRQESTVESSMEFVIGVGAMDERKPLRINSGEDWEVDLANGCGGLEMDAVKVQQNGNGVGFQQRGSSASQPGAGQKQQQQRNGSQPTAERENGSLGWVDGSAGQRAGDPKVGLLAAQTIAKARQNAKRQAWLILAAYLTFWSPYNLLAICNAFSGKDSPVREISSISLPFLNSLIVVNPIVNPLIYGVFDDCRWWKPSSSKLPRFFSLRLPGLGWPTMMGGGSRRLNGMMVVTKMDN